MHTDRRGYAYETFREGGRVCRRYVGRGEVADALVQIDRLDRQRQRDKRQFERARIEQITTGSDELAAFCAASNAVFRAAMEAGGYHQHKRGAWRRARNPMAKKQTPSAPMIAAFEPENRKRFDVLKRAQNGDAAAAREALDVLKNTPGERAWIEGVAPLLKRAREAMAYSATNELGKAAMVRAVDLMRDELAGPNASPLEVMLAERVALCFYQVTALTALYTTMQIESLSSAGAILKHLDAAHKRHLDAVKALATIRKLQLPNVQVNIGEKQVNIGTVNGKAAGAATHVVSSTNTAPALDV